MKRLTALLLILISFSLAAQIQISIPEAPKKIEFADVIINLDDATQKEVNKEITSLLTPQNSFLDAKLKRMQWYFPIIERILEDQDVPDDLKFISVMESSLIPEALSTSGAVGYWQFKEPTAEELGLLINKEVDERKNIHEATEAAALYFKRNNLIFKNWISCIYAYYQGPTGAATKLPDEWSYASEVDFTSKTPKYLIRALAHRIAFEHRLNRLKGSPNQFVEYTTKDKSLAQIAAELTVDISELRKYNTWLLSASMPSGKPYTVLVPVRNEDAATVLGKINARKDFKQIETGFPQMTQLAPSSSDPNAPTLYDINGKKGLLAEPGEEVAQLAKKGGIKILSFLKFNDMSDRDMVKSGKAYYLQKKSKKAQVPFHTVRTGETLWDIAQMYGMRVKSVLKFNRLTSMQRLQPGRVMWLQKKRPKNQPVEIIREAIPVEPEPQPQLPVVQEYESEEVVVEPPKVKAPVIIEEEPAEPLIQKIKEGKRVIVVEQEKEYTAPLETTKAPQPDKTEIVYADPKDMRSNGGKSTHRVARGETLFSLARRYGVSVADIRKWNGMTSSDVLQYDQVLTVSSAATKTTPTYEDDEYGEPSQPVTNPRISAFHKVKKGETLYSISKRYDMSVATLKNMNDLRNNTISVGQSLKVSGIAATVVTPAQATTHVVRRGETLYSISKKHKTTVANIKSWNNLRNNTISVGQILEIR